MGLSLLRDELIETLCGYERKTGYRKIKEITDHRKELPIMKLYKEELC
jgi:hypothetical protein